MQTMAVQRLRASEIAGLDPYALMAVIGKRVIYVGCGVGTTAIELARRFGCEVTAVDISSQMLDRACANVRAAGMEDHVTIQCGDILALPHDDGAFDRVIAEAVTMFVDRPAAMRELVRVCRPGGRVLTIEFLWRRPPSVEARQIFLGEVCPGMHFETQDDWIALHRQAGLTDVEITSGPFEMMTSAGFLGDEGVLGSLRFMARACSRLTYLQKLAWLMPRMQRAVPYLGYITLSGVKSA